VHFRDIPSVRWLTNGGRFTSCRVAASADDVALLRSAGVRNQENGYRVDLKAVNEDLMMDRRAFMTLALGAAAFGRAELARAEQERGLFWRIETPDNALGIVFGYARTAASVVPGVVEDGVRLIEQSNRVLLDMDNIKFPPVTTNEKMPPLLPMLSRPVSDELREVLAAQPIPQPQVDGLPGLLIAMLLNGEGQTKPVMPSVGGAIVDRAKGLHLSVTALLARSEVEKLQKPVDLVALNNTVDEKMIAFLLDVRRQVGPIGRHCETIYRERKGEELYQFVKSLGEHGVPESQTFLEGEAGREWGAARTIETPG
jgi:hypothetical protein